MNEIVNDITRAEAIANVIAGTGTSFQNTMAKAVLIRFPLDLLVQIDSMADRARKSRNLMVADLLRVGIDEVRRELPDEVVDAIDQRSVIEYSQLVEYAQNGDNDDSIYAALKG